jgi:hypothetical protein
MGPLGNGMLPKAQKATFAIADISGYTRFLARVEIEHGQDIVADFLSTVVAALQPAFRLAKFEGDAAFLYAPGEAMDGSVLQDLVEGAYFAFRRRLRDVRQASACNCDACTRMADLDFKFVIHQGEMVVQRMAGLEELAGRDVIVVHRLLKNRVSEVLGHGAYALYSEACVAATGIDASAQGLVAATEDVDDIGAMRVWVRDLRDAWQREEARERRLVAPEAAYVHWAFDLPAPQQVVWDYATVPGQWQQWWFATAISEVSETGRRGVGTQNHCMHGDAMVIEEILDWSPPDYFTISITLLVPDAPQIVMTRAISAGLEGGSVLEMRVETPAPEHRHFVDQAGAQFAAQMFPAIERFRDTLSAQQAAVDVPAEPAPEARKARFLSEPQR